MHVHTCMHTNARTQNQEITLYKMHVHETRKYNHSHDHAFIFSSVTHFILHELNTVYKVSLTVYEHT